MAEDTKNPYCRCLYYSATALSRLVTKMAEEEFSITGLSPSYAFIMMSLNKNADGLTPTKLADIMMLSPSTITRLVEKLENKSLVKRTIDGRQVVITSTSKGMEMNGKILEAWNNYYQRYSEILGKDFGEQLTEKIYAAAKKLDTGS